MSLRGPLFGPTRTCGTGQVSNPLLDWEIASTLENAPRNDIKIETKMNLKRLQNIFKIRNLLSLSIPAGIIIANLFFPLSPVLRQALVGVVLVWLFVEATTGFTLFTETTAPAQPHRETYNMKKTRFAFTPTLYVHSFYAVLIVAAVTVLLLLIGRNILGEAVIALLYLVPVIWSAARWGQLPGLAAALTAALLFDYCFIPPFNTFTVGSIEGWLVLGIFLLVAGVLVGRIQAILARAQASEREAMLMYELSTILAQSSSQQQIVQGVARFLQQRYLAALVTISVQPQGQPNETAAYEPRDGILKGKPDRTLALLDAKGLVGEIQIWRGEIDLPAEDSRLFQNFSSQVGHVLERTYPANAVSSHQKTVISNQ